MAPAKPPPPEKLSRLDKLLVEYRHGESLPPSDPPSDPPSEPPVKVRKKQDSALDLAEVTARWSSALKSIIAGAAVIIGVAGTAATWAINRWVLEPRLQELKDQLDPLVLRPSAAELKRLRDEQKKPPPALEDRFAEVRADIANLRRAIDAPNDPKSELGKKLDALDKTIQERLPARPNKPSAPPIGPTAAQEGRK